MGITSRPSCATSTLVGKTRKGTFASGFGELWRDLR
jgi:hypothetical protein